MVMLAWTRSTNWATDSGGRCSRKSDDKRLQMAGTSHWSSESQFTLETVRYIWKACQWGEKAHIFVSKSDSGDVWWRDVSWPIKVKDRDNEQKTKTKDDDNEMKKTFRKYLKVKIMLLHDCTWCYQVCQMRTSRDLSQFRFHPIFPRYVVSCKTIIDKESDSISYFSVKHVFNHKSIVHCCPEI